MLKVVKNQQRCFLFFCGSDCVTNRRVIPPKAGKTSLVWIRVMRFFFDISRIYLEHGWLLEARSRTWGARWPEQMVNEAYG